MVLTWVGLCLTIAAVVFTILTTFHTYLAFTNQTTYEMMKSKLHMPVAIANVHLPVSCFAILAVFE